MEIKLKNISYKYEESSKLTLDNINLTIRKGQSIAFVGPTGAGKSTLIDIITGLLVPDKGNIMIDNDKIEDCNENWQENIGYVPQSTFIMDDSLMNNIAFGIPKELIDEEAVKNAINLANLETFVRNLPYGLNTILGECGARISGGEKQRIAIARALYKDPDVLIFDEATSSLDSDTEKKIINEIEILKKDKTIISIAHRIYTIKNYDYIYF